VRLLTRQVWKYLIASLALGLASLGQSLSHRTDDTRQERLAVRPDGDDR
jgi:hypothetical protein